MTREQFLSVVQFTIGPAKYKGDSTYNYEGGHISRQSRSSIDDRVILNDYECNVDRIGRVSFSGFTYVMGKKVVVTYRFESLVEFETDKA
jgi:hypothetical protein